MIASLMQPHNQHLLRLIVGSVWVIAIVVLIVTAVKMGRDE